MKKLKSQDIVILLSKDSGERFEKTETIGYSHFAFKMSGERFEKTETIG